MIYRKVLNIDLTPSACISEQRNLFAKNRNFARNHEKIHVFFGQLMSVKPWQNQIDISTQNIAKMRRIIFPSLFGVVP